MKKMREHREEMPQYAQRESISVTGEQLLVILRGLNPFKDDAAPWARVNGRVYSVAFLRDGSCWVQNYRSGGVIFGPDYWWRLPATAGKRVRRLQDFVETTLSEK